MPYLLRVNAYPSEHSMHGTLGMLLAVDAEWIKEQMARIQIYKEHKAKGDSLSHHKYWVGYFPVVDMSGLLDMDELTDRLDNCELIEITNKEADVISNCEVLVRLDMQQIEIHTEVHLTARGKFNELEYESENLTESDLNEILKSL
jgi:hypothetical protein